jgi:acyl-CoA synthetase (AMP-forming)/AMP-acid ligase II
MSEAETIAQLLETGAADAIAISAPEGVPPLRYRDLRSLAERTVETLNALGIGRNDRVAIVLPNGPEMAASFVCIGAGATTAPLNPSYRAEEFEFYLADLRAKALVVEAGSDSPARGVAKKLAIPIIEKVSPLEVDEVLMDHPAVAQVVTFAVPHDKLGEEVAAAVVLREGKTATDRELRDFCAGRLADFKVPRKIVLLAEIPKGATGKLQRIGLAAKLGLAP